MVDSVTDKKIKNKKINKTPSIAFKRVFRLVPSNGRTPG